jgi:hypothetical protein
MEKLYIYEAGSLTYLYDNDIFKCATEWRDKLDTWAKDNGVYTFNPAKTFLKEKNHTYSGQMAVRQNDLYLDKTNIMVMQMDYLDYSPGTIYEIVSYKRLYPWKPVISFSLISDLHHKNPHIESCISEHCRGIDSVIELLSNMFGQSLK